MTTKVKPAVAVSGSDVNQNVNSSSPIPIPEGFLAKPPLDDDDGISSEEEEEDDEEEGEDEEEEQEEKCINSRRTSSASVSSQNSEGNKEKVANKEATNEIEAEKVAKKDLANDIKSDKVTVKKVEVNEIDDKKPIKNEPINHSLSTTQVKLEKVSIVKVKKEPNTRDDEDEKSEGSGNDSGVESGSGDSSTNSTTDAKNIPPPKIGSLTILGPSLLKSSVKHGALSITPANALSSPLNALSVLTDSTNSGSATGFVDAPLSNEYIPLDKLALMGTTMRRSSVGAEKCEVCGEQAADTAALEAHRMAQKHYKCSVAVDCSALIFETRHDLTMHKLNCHGIQPTPPPSPLDQLTTPPNSQLYRGPVPNAQPQPGSIQPRSFASLAAPPSQQNNADLLNPVSTNQLMAMKRMQAQAPTDAPLAKGRRMDVSLDNGIPMQGGANPVQLRPGSSVSISAAPQKGSSNSVANLLATRGITVTPSESNRSQPQAAIAQSSPSRPLLPPVPAPLTLSSAISILPASSQTRQGASFASPQGRSRANQPPTLNLPTVDLTKDTPRQQHSAPTAPPQLPRGRPPRARTFTCQVCDKGFQTREALSVHMSSHSSPGKLSHRCNLCNAQYPTQQGLAQHKQTFHKDSNSGSEMALPVVDLKQPGVPERLASLGIRHCIPLSQLQSQSGGLFGVPIIAIDSARSPAQANLGGLGASNILSLGPLKSIPPR